MAFKIIDVDVSWKICLQDHPYDKKIWRTDLCTYCCRFAELANNILKVS